MSPAEVAGLMCGARAQVLSAAELSMRPVGDDASGFGGQAGLGCDRALIQPRRGNHAGVQLCLLAGVGALIGRRIAGAARADRLRTGRKLTITVEPLRELTASQRRQLHDEASLVAQVMEATATLTVGPVTAGAHA